MGTKNKVITLTLDEETFRFYDTLASGNRSIRAALIGRSVELGRELVASEFRANNQEAVARATKLLERDGSSTADAA